MLPPLSLQVRLVATHGWTNPSDSEDTNSQSFYDVDGTAVDDDDDEHGV